MSSPAALRSCRVCGVKPALLDEATCATCLPVSRAVVSDLEEVLGLPHGAIWLLRGSCSAAHAGLLLDEGQAEMVLIRLRRLAGAEAALARVCSGLLKVSGGHEEAWAAVGDALSALRGA